MCTQCVHDMCTMCLCSHQSPQTVFKSQSHVTMKSIIGQCLSHDKCLIQSQDQLPSTSVAWKGVTSSHMILSRHTTNVAPIHMIPLLHHIITVYTYTNVTSGTNKSCHMTIGHLLSCVTRRSGITWPIAKVTNHKPWLLSRRLNSRTLRAVSVALRVTSIHLKTVTCTCQICKS